VNELPTYPLELTVVELSTLLATIRTQIRLMREETRRFPRLADFNNALIVPLADLQKKVEAVAAQTDSDNTDETDSLRRLLREAESTALLLQPPTDNRQA
jgi:hypothetical protein